MIKLFTLLLLAAPFAAAQLQLSVYDGTERPVTGITDLGGAAMGDSLEIRLHARNATVAGIALQSLSVSGQSFAVSDRPPLPYIVAPGNFVEFRLRFAPVATGSYSASLSVNGGSWLLKAAGFAAPVLTPDATGPATIISAGSSIDFGRILKNTSTSRTLRLANGSTGKLTVNAIAVSGPSFHGPGGLTLPADLAPGAAVDFAIAFDPKASGPQNGTLTVDGRVYQLAGEAYDPPFPRPAITVTGASASAAQPRLSVGFAEAAGLSGSGTLTLDFRPAVIGVIDDPAIYFLNTGSRKLTFQVKEGQTAASFGSLTEVPFQTGTTAGTITLTAQIGDQMAQSTINIDPAAVSLDHASAIRRVSNIDVTITAFDNTRTAGRFQFTFYDRSGRVIAPGAMTVDVSGDFGRYFAISRVGGAFLLRTTFPITGDATQVGGVEAALINAAGTTKTARLDLQ